VKLTTLFAVGLTSVAMVVGLGPSQAANITLPGMPSVQNSNDIYSADRPGLLSSIVKNFPSLIYVPNTNSNSVSVIDPKTMKVIGVHKVAREPQHVVPSWDLKTLWVNSDIGNTLTPINPATGKFGKPITVNDPYNLYFTPDGKYAVVMSEAARKIVFRDPHTMVIEKQISSQCEGVNHADWSADGKTFVVSCEFSGQLLLVDTAKMKILKKQTLPNINHAVLTKVHNGIPNSGPMPQDVKLSPDGKTFYIADMMSDGIWTMPAPWGKVSFIKTGVGAHGLYVMRDSKTMLISNRNEGTISVLRFTDNVLVAKWKIPGGGSPDMGGISTDGKVFWVSGRYDGVVYAISTVNGHLIKKIKVGSGPHGLAVYPQPGRYSLGHTGIFR
jgi:YVTN family beta-propeller protein